MSVHCALWAVASGNAFQCCYVALMHMPGFLRRILTQLSYLCFSRECLCFVPMHHLSNTKCSLKAVACFLVVPVMQNHAKAINSNALANL